MKAKAELQVSPASARHARPPALTTDLSLPETAREVLREMWAQFTINLRALRDSDEPELVHQARVGWRRFQSACRLFRPALAGVEPPVWPALKPLLRLLGELRDLDVARTETLPPLADAFVGGDPARAKAWRALMASLSRAAARQRRAVRLALDQSEVRASLLAATQWLEGFPALQTKEASKGGSPRDRLHPAPFLRRWARARMAQMDRRLQRALESQNQPDGEHRLRLLAKRMRYSVEALRPLLPRRRAQGWHDAVCGLQARIGVARDLAQACALAAQFKADADLVAFLRGAVAGRSLSE